MIEEISEVNSRKGGNLTPGGSQKPRAADPEADEKGGRSCTEARVTNLPHASGRTKDDRSCQAAPTPLREEYSVKASYFDPSSAAPRNSQEKRRKDKVSVNKTRCHKK